MSKKVLIISSSGVVGGNTDLLVEQFKKGAMSKGNEVEVVNLREKKINFCCGCQSCYTTGKCIYHDDMESLNQKMIDTDVLVLATPVYFYSMNGQLKTFIDRSVPIYTKIAHKDIYLLVACWDDNKDNIHSTIEALRGFTRDCLPDCVEKGTIIATGCANKGDVKKTPFFEEAFTLGASII